MLNWDCKKSYQNWIEFTSKSFRTNETSSTVVQRISSDQKVKTYSFIMIQDIVILVSWVSDLISDWYSLLPVNGLGWAFVCSKTYKAITLSWYRYGKFLSCCSCSIRRQIHSLNYFRCKTKCLHFVLIVWDLLASNLSLQSKFPAYWKRSYIRDQQFVRLLRCYEKSYQNVLQEFARNFPKSHQVSGKLHE